HFILTAVGLLWLDLLEHVSLAIEILQMQIIHHPESVIHLQHPFEMQHAGIWKLKTHVIEDLVKEFGGFDLIIGGNYTSCKGGTTLDSDATSKLYKYEGNPRLPSWLPHVCLPSIAFQIIT
ncbi:hypothetical protein ACJX0J_034878, partial [Zea mays]